MRGGEGEGEGEGGGGAGGGGREGRGGRGGEGGREGRGGCGYLPCSSLSSSKSTAASLRVVCSLLAENWISI